MGWSGPWKGAVDHATEFLFDRCLSHDGLFRDARAGSADAASRYPLVYDQAFVVLALAAAARSFPEDSARYRDAAGELMIAIHATYGLPGGVVRELRRGRWSFQSNPLMHLLEAALAWVEIDDSGEWGRVADTIVEFCLDRMVDPRNPVVAEYFASDWRAAPGRTGRIMVPGHQFEWASLLARWGAMRGRSDAERAIHGLFRSGEGGVDPARGVAVNLLIGDRVANGGIASLWPQSERLRAAVLLAHAEGGSMLPRAAEQAATTLLRYLDVPVRGLWREGHGPIGLLTDDPARATTLYHLVSAIAAASNARQNGRPFGGAEAVRSRPPA